MFVLMLLSILLKLVSAHYLLLCYRDKKLKLRIFLLGLLFIAILVVNDFAALNFFLRRTLTSPQVFMVVMTILLSTVLLMLSMEVKRHIPIDVAEVNDLSDQHQFISKLTKTLAKRPLILIDDKKSIVFMSEGFRELLGLGNLKTTVFAITLNRLFGRLITIEELKAFKHTVHKITGPGKSAIHCKVTTYTYDDSQLIGICFDDYSDEVKLEKEMEILKTEMNRQDYFLKPGQWRYLFSEDAINCSKRTQEILGVLDESVAFDVFKKMIHPEDLMSINILDNKSLWMSGKHTRYMRLYTGEGLKYAAIHYKSLYDEQGLPAGAEGVIQEITDQRDYIAKHFLKEKNDHISAVMTECEQRLVPLLRSLKQEPTIVYAHNEIKKSIDFFEQSKKSSSHMRESNLVTVDKLIEQTIDRYRNLYTQFDIHLALESQHLLLALDEQNFIQMLSHYLTEFSYFTYRVPLLLKTYACDEGFVFDCLLGHHPRLKAFMHAFEDKLMTPPKDVADGSLFHAYTIVKKFNGRVEIINGDMNSGLRVVFPAINMLESNKKEDLNQVLYYGDYPILRQITTSFLKQYDIDVMNHHQENKGIEAYKVVIFDESISSGEQQLLAQKNPNIQFVSLGLPEVLKRSNMMHMQQPIRICELTSVLGEKFELKQFTGVVDEVIEAYELLEVMDKDDIDATSSFKRNGRNAGLYFDCLKLYNLYYGSNFERLHTLWTANEYRQLENLVLKMHSEASVLGLSGIEDFLSNLHLKGYEILACAEGQSQYKRTFDTLKMNIMRIDQYDHKRSHQLEAMEDERRKVVVLIEECLEALKREESSQSRALLQELLYCQVMTPFEELLVEVGVFAKGQNYERAVERLKVLNQIIRNKQVII